MRLPSGVTTDSPVIVKPAGTVTPREAKYSSAVIRPWSRVQAKPVRYELSYRYSPTSSVPSSVMPLTSACVSIGAESGRTPRRCPAFHTPPVRTQIAGSRIRLAGL